MISKLCDRCGKEGSFRRVYISGSSIRDAESYDVCESCWDRVEDALAELMEFRTKRRKMAKVEEDDRQSRFDPETGSLYLEDSSLEAGPVAYINRRDPLEKRTKLVPDGRGSFRWGPPPKEEEDEEE